MVGCSAVDETPNVTTIDGGRGIRIKVGVMPESSDPSEAMAAIAAKLNELREHCPEGHFLKYAKAECAGLRDGRPRGKRFYLIAVFQKYPDR